MQITDQNLPPQLLPRPIAWVNGHWVFKRTVPVYRKPCRRLVRLGTARVLTAAFLGADHV